MGGGVGGALRGRQDDLQRVRAAGRAVVVQGEAGIGKSRLVAEVARLAQDEGRTVLAGRVSELETTRPFGVLVDAFGLYRPVVAAPLQDVADLLRSEAVAGAGDVMPALRFRILDAFHAALEELTARDPVLLVLEDLHWADESSLLFFRHTVERFAGLPLQVVATRRAIPRSPELDRIEELPAVEAIRLRPLPDSTVEELVADRFGAPPGPYLAARLRSAEGNPLFIHELLDALDSAGAVTVTTHAETEEAVLPESFHAAILRRLSYLPEATLRSLRLAAVLGSRFAFTDLATVAGVAATDLAGQLDPAIEAGLLMGHAAQLEFRHDLVRDAIYADVPEAVRTAMHAQIARDLRAAGVPLERLAAHISLAAQPGDAQAAMLLSAAAQACAPRAPGLAATLLQRALEIAPDHDPQTGSMSADLTRALLWSGDFHRAELRARQLLSGSHAPELGATVRYALARVLVYRGDLTAAVDELRAALAEPDLSSDQRARLLADLAVRLQVVRDVEGAATAADAALAGAAGADGLARGVALCARSRMADHRGLGAEAVRFAREAVATADSGSTDAIALLQPQLYLALALSGAQQSEEAIRVAQAGLRAAETAGSTWMSPLFHLAAALGAYGAGSWDDAVTEARLSLALAHETGVVVWRDWAAAVEVLVAVHRNELGRVHSQVAHLEPTGAPRFGSDTIALAVAAAHRASGDDRAALGALRTEWEAWPQHQRPVGLAAELAVLGGAAGAADIAAEAVGVLAAASDAAGTGAAVTLAVRARVERSPALATQALDTAGSPPAPLQMAWVQEIAGGVLADGGDPGAAAGALAAAAHGFSALTAVHDAARTEGALRSLGVRRGRRGARDRPKSGWDSLTTSELAVLDLLMEGLSNREIGERLFISRRTVDSHVSRMLSKIGVSSRVALVAEAARHT